MSTSAEVVKVFIENGDVCINVKVLNENTYEGKPVAIEYVGRIPYTPLWDTLSDGQKAALLKAAAREARTNSKLVPNALTINSLANTITI